jgi:hypothetical protein
MLNNCFTLGEETGKEDSVAENTLSASIFPPERRNGSSESCADVRGLSDG